MSTKKSNKIDSYTERARLVQDYLNKDLRYNNKHLPRPFFIEFFGMPSAGKSGAIHRLYKFLSLLGLRVKKYQEPGELIRVPHNTPLFNIRTGLRILDELLELGASANYDVVIFERGILDTYCWMNFWLKKGMLTKKECDQFQSFFTSRLWLKTVDVAFFLSCHYKVGIKRNAKGNVLLVDGETINNRVMSALELNYSQCLKKLSRIAPQIFKIKTDKISTDQVAKAVCDHAIYTLTKLAKQRSGISSSAS